MLGATLLSRCLVSGLLEGIPICLQKFIVLESRRCIFYHPLSFQEYDTRQTTLIGSQSWSTPCSSELKKRSFCTITCYACIVVDTGVITSWCDATIVCSSLSTSGSMER